jgi:uncharacterized protein (DUF433 family)
MELCSLIQSDPEVVGRTPVFVGTWSGEELVRSFGAGESISDFLEGFPSVRREQVIGLLEKSRRELLKPA